MSDGNVTTSDKASVHEPQFSHNIEHLDGSVAVFVAACQAFPRFVFQHGRRNLIICREYLLSSCYDFKVRVAVLKPMV